MLPTLYLLYCLCTLRLARCYIVTDYLVEEVTTFYSGHPSLSIPPGVETDIQSIVPTIHPPPSPTAETTTVTEISELGGPVTIVAGFVPGNAGVHPTYSGSGYQTNFFAEFTYTACTASPTVATFVTALYWSDPLIGLLRPTNVPPILPLPSSASYFISGPVTNSLVETEIPAVLSRSWKYSLEPNACYDQIYTPATTSADAAAAPCSYLPLTSIPSFRCGANNPCCSDCNYFNEQEAVEFAFDGVVKAEWFVCPDGKAYFAAGNVENSNLNGRPPAFLQDNGMPNEAYGLAITSFAFLWTCVGLWGFLLSAI